MPTEKDPTPATLPSVMALAYLGDAVYSLWVRCRLVAFGLSHAGELNALSLSYVTAEKQAQRMARILPLLSPWEEGFYRRAVNHKGLRRPRHAALAEYRAATGFEALLGALEYVGDRARLAFLLEEAHKGDPIEQAASLAEKPADTAAKDPENP